MGYTVLPGHKQDANKDWQEFSSLEKDFLDEIVFGRFELGNFGKFYNENDDKYAAHYSIPNPWASAYLFHNVLKDPSHPLIAQIIELMLNLLNDLYNYRKLELFKVKKPTQKSPFYKFWRLAPPFLKFGDEMFFLRDRNTLKILGGISKTTIVWAAQQYSGEKILSELMDESDLANYLDYIKGKKDVPEPIWGMTFDTFK